MEKISSAYRDKTFQNIRCPNNRLFTRDIWGGSPLQSGSIYQGGGQKTGEKGGFRSAEVAAKNFEHFFEVFGKFVNKSAIKSDFGGGVGRYIYWILKEIELYFPQSYWCKTL